MNYVIYYDESNKLDQPEKKYSYYGAYGGEAETIEGITGEVQDILNKLKTESELHFNKYTNDGKLVKYFRALNYVINQAVTFNIFIINNEDAETLSKKMDIEMKTLRGLMYIKIPERLFYGITRHINIREIVTSVDIIVDQNDEYGDLDLYTKLRDQMNAHSIYRNRNYVVQSVEPKESKDTIPLQIIDNFMGMVVFMMEKLYLEESDVSMIKSDLIYRFLSVNQNILRFQNQITLYKWEAAEESISKVNIGDYISEFFAYKTEFDIKEMTRLQKMMIENPTFTTKQLRESMGYTNNCLRMILGYKDQIQGKGRNSFLLGQFGQ